MRKLMAASLAVVMMLSVLLAVPFGVLAENVTYHYSNIDFTESGYANGANVVDTNVVLTTNADSTYGAAMKFTYLRNGNNKNFSKCMRLVDNTGDEPLMLKPSTKYRITYQVKAVSAPANFSVGLYLVTNNNLAPNKAPADYHSYTTSSLASGYNYGSAFEFTSSTATNTRVLLGIFNSTSGAADRLGSQEIYLDNIIITEQTALSYSGADATGLPTTAWANQTYEEVLGAAAVNWYLDAGCTTPATGIINADAVTLYAKGDLYSNIDFTESVYNSNANMSNAEIAAYGGNNAVKLTRNYANNYRSGVLLSDNSGSSLFAVKAGTTYKISYKVLTVSSNYEYIIYGCVASGNGYGNVSQKVESKRIASVGETAVANPQWETGSVEITPLANGFAAIYIGNGSSKQRAVEVYFDDIVISEKTTLNYVNTDNIEGLPSYAWANQTYEEVFDSFKGIAFYTDAAMTTQATGVINNSSVTLYPKVLGPNIIDFEESVYEGNPSISAIKVEKTIGADKNGGAAGKLTRLRYSNNEYLATIRLANHSGNGYMTLEKDKIYVLTYDIKTVKADVDFNVCVGTTTNTTSAAYNFSKKDAQIINTHEKFTATPESPAVWQSIPATKQFTARNTGDALIVFHHQTSGGGSLEDQEIYIDNIQISELESRDLVLHLNNGQADSTAIVTQLSKFEDINKPTREDYIFTGWFLDEQLTLPAKGGVSDTAEVWAGWVEEASSTTVTFDEPELSFSGEENTSWTMSITGTDNSVQIAATGGNIGTTTDKNGNRTKAARFTRARELTKAWPANVRVYTSSPLDTGFVMDAYSAYDVTFSYRVDAKPSGSLYFHVLGVYYPTGTAGNPMNGTYDRTRILSYAVETVSAVTDGWQTATATFYTAGTQVIPHIALVSSTGDEATNVNVWVDDITVAQRTDIKKISFNTNGGNTLSDMNAIIGTVPPAFPVPVKADKVFAGWFTDVQCTAPYTEPLMPDRDVLLYAGWTDKVTAPYEFETGFGASDYQYTNTGSTQLTDNLNSVGVTLDSSAMETIENGGVLKFNDLTGAVKEDYDRYVAAALVDKNGKVYQLVEGTRYKVTMSFRFTGGVKENAYLNFTISDSTPNGGINATNSTLIRQVFSNSMDFEFINEWYTDEYYFIAPASGKAYLTFYSSVAEQPVEVDSLKIELVEDGEASLVEYYNEDGSKLLNRKYGKAGSVLIDGDSQKKEGFSFNGWRIGSSAGEQWLSNKFPTEDTKLYASWVTADTMPEYPTTDFSKPVIVDFDNTNDVKAFYGDSAAFAGGSGGSMYGMYVAANDPDGARSGTGYFRMHKTGHWSRQYYRKFAFYHNESPGNRIWLEPDSAYKVSYWYKPDEVGACNLYTVGFNTEYEYGYEIFSENYMNDANIVSQFGKWNYFETTIFTGTLPTYLGVAVYGGHVSASFDDITVIKLNNILVNYESNGGSDVPSAVQLSHNYLNPPAEPEREGYNFAGWYSDTALKNLFDFGNTLVTEDMTLYAKWEAKQYKTVVTYEDKEVEVEVTPEDAHLDEAFDITKDDKIGNINTASNGITLWMWLIIAAGAVVLAGGAILIIVLIKKRKEDVK